MRALQKRCLETVRAALAAEPEAALLPFWEYQLEPPLCHAVRAGCGADICRLLLQHGADVNAADMKGRTPMDWVEEERFSRENLVDQLLPPFPGADEHPCMFFASLDAVELVLAEAGGVRGATSQGRQRRRNLGEVPEPACRELFPQLPRFTKGGPGSVQTSK